MLVHVHHLEAQVVILYDFRHHGDVAQHLHHEAAQRVIRPLLLARQVEVQVQRRAQAVDRHPAVHQPRPVLALHHVLILGKVRHRKLPDDRGQHVRQRHEPLEPPVLVHDQRKLHARRAEILQQLRRRHAFRHKKRVSHRRLHVQRTPLQHRLEQIARAQDSDHVIQPVAADRDALVWAVCDRAPHIVLRVDDIDPINVAARRHDRHDALLVEPQHVRHELLLTFVENPRFRPLLHQHVDLVVCHRRLVLPFDPQEAQQQPRRRRQQPHQRTRNARNRVHRTRHHRRHAFGREQAKTFRKQLSEHHRDVRQSDDHDRQRQPLRVRLEHRIGRQPDFQRIGQRRLSDRTAQDADGRDSDLDRRQEPRRLVVQRERELRARGPVICQAPQAHFPGRHHRDFGHREHAVQQNQDQ